jgi:hypothetical protein
MRLWRRPASEPPRMADAFPEMTAEIIEMLRDEGWDDLATQFEGLRYHGRCQRTLTCPCLATNGEGRTGSAVIMLERDEECLFWLHMDDDATTVLAVEVLDGGSTSPR